MAYKAMTWEYVAGFFDGEGCVDCRVIRNGGGGWGNQFRLKFYQNSGAVLRAIQEFLDSEGIPSRVEVHTRPDRLAKGHSGSYALVIGGAQLVTKMLLELEPYCIVKADEIGKALDWLRELADDALDDVPVRNFNRNLYLRVSDVFESYSEALTEGGEL